MISQAALKLPIGVDDLQSRLQAVADTQHSSPKPAAWESQSESSVSAAAPTIVNDLETSSYHELIEDGGRAVCSVQEMSSILAAPMDQFMTLLPWLTDDPATDIGGEEIKTVFSRQFMRWWTFRKSQWVSRGFTDMEKAICAFLKSSKNRYERMGSKEMTAEDSFSETIRRQWRRIPSFLKTTDQTFPSYHKFVKTALAPYDFARPVQLRRDPQKQTRWTGWLEYLCFELRHLEHLTLAVESKRAKFDRALSELLEIERPLENQAVRNSLVLNAASDGLRREDASDIDISRRLAKARADRDAAWKAIDDFGREVKPYTQARRAVLCQQRRVEWVVREARLMEREMASDHKSAISRKRRQAAEDVPERSAKRTRRVLKDMHPEAFTLPSKPHPRRSTRLLDGSSSTA